MKVLIIGAGVAGLSVARFLENNGIDFLLVEKREKIGKYRNCVMSKEAFKKLKLPKNIILYKIKKLNFYSPSLTKLSYSSKKERGYVVNLKDIEKFLYEKIDSKKNILLGKRVSEIGFEKKRVNIDGKIVKYDYLTLACGIEKEFLEKYGIKIPRFVFCYAIEIENLKEETSVIFDNRIAKNFYGWIMPLKKGIEIGFGNSSLVKNFRDSLFKIKPFQKFKNEKIRKIDGGIIPINVPLSNFKSRNYLLIGDALGGEPIFGGSIHKAFEDAKLAGEVLSKNFGEPLESIAEKYYSSWKELFFDEIKKQNMIRKFLNKLSNKKLDELFERLKSVNFPKTKGLINDLFIEMIKHAKALS